MKILNLEGEGKNQKINKLSFDETNIGLLFDISMFQHLIKMACHRAGTGTLCIVDSRAYTNTQLEPRTGPNQVHVYLEDQIQQSPTKHWQARCKNVPWTRGTLFSLPFFFSSFSEAVFASNFCQSAGRGSWVGSGKDGGQSRGFDNEVCIHMMEPNELVLKKKAHHFH